jgi:putative ABC transport system ATP-binding protein
MNIIEVKNLTKSYSNGEIIIPALRGVNFSAEKGEFVAIMGKSGAGKSTLLYQMSLLDNPTSGSIEINGTDVLKMTDVQKSKFKLSTLGYIFQDHALLPELTAIENVAIPLMMQGFPKNECCKNAISALERIGLGNRLNNLPSQLSGGEQQRVGIARAIAHNPKIIFADEPTASLDSEASKNIMDIFLELNKQGETIILVTHEPEYGALAGRLVTLEDGRVVSSCCDVGKLNQNGKL